MQKFSKKYKIHREKDLYTEWEEQGLFNQRKSDLMPMMPLSLAADLHLGHAFSLTLQDVFVRYFRMYGKSLSWVPSFHHSSFLVQVALEKQLKSSGKKALLKKKDFSKSMSDYLLKQKESHKNTMKALGLSCDRSKELFTFSESYTRFVKNTFADLYEQGIIYQERDITYWNKVHQTVVGVTDLHREKVESTKYHVRYFIDTKKESLLVGTFRPDTIFADVALAVHPLDKRYKKFLGKKVIIPIINKAIPIVVDEAVDMTVDQGVYRVTPGHDPLGLDIAKRHELPLDFFAIDQQGNFTDLAGIFAGKPVVDFFENIIQYLGDISNLDATRTMEESHSFPVCNKTGVVLEPLAMHQWFISIPEQVQDHFSDFLNSGDLNTLPADQKVLLELFKQESSWCISRQHSVGQALPVLCDTKGNSFVVQEQNIFNLYTKEKSKTYLFMSVVIFHLILDGHLDPHFSLEELVTLLLRPSLENNRCTTFEVYFDLYSDLFLSKKMHQKEIEKYRNIMKEFTLKKGSDEQAVNGIALILDKTFLINSKDIGYRFDFEHLLDMKKGVILSQEGSTFDSSFACVLHFWALHENYDKKNLFDKIWVGNNHMSLLVRMGLLNILKYRDPLFSSAVVHGLLFDGFNDLMGFVGNNAVNPLPLISLYGADTLRISLLGSYKEQNTFVYDSSDLPKSAHLVNKLWNACRYAFLTVVGDDVSVKLFDLEILGKDISKNLSLLEVFDIWILYVIQEYIDEIQDYIEQGMLGISCQKVLGLITHEFCDWYLEIIKMHSSEYTSKVLLWGMGMVIKILHPYMPFVTQNLWKKIGFIGEVSIQNITILELPGKNYKVHLFMDIVRTLLNLKEQNEVKKHEVVEVFVQATPDFLETIEVYEDVLKKIVNTKEIYYLRQHETPDSDYAVDSVIDIHVGIKKVIQQSKKEYLYDLQDQLVKKKEFLQYLRGLISAASMNDNIRIVEQKQKEMENIREEIDSLEYELGKIKSK